MNGLAGRNLGGKEKKKPVEVEPEIRGRHLFAKAGEESELRFPDEHTQQYKEEKEKKGKKIFMYGRKGKGASVTSRMQASE